MELYNNYWKLIKEEIPSMGYFYKPDSVIKIRPLYGPDGKYLSTLCPQNATDVINEIIQKCIILENIQFDELLLADREYLIFWLRANSFSINNGYELHLKCDKCGEQFNKEVQLAEFPTILLDENKAMDRIIDLPDCNLQVRLRQPRIKDLKKVSNDYIIELFMRYMDIDAPNKTLETFLNGLSALDYSILKNNVDDMFIGFDRKITTYCPKCGEAYTYKIEITDSGLFGKVNVGDVLDMILRICKYTNYQIPETQPWWEVEIMHQNVTKMIEEEKQQMEKDDGKITMSRASL